MPKAKQVVACLVEVEQNVLLLQTREGKHGEGLWALPAGKVDPGELPIDAVLRELREETGLSVMNGSEIHLVCEDMIENATRFICYRLVLPTAPNIKIDSSEHAAHVWRGRQDVVDANDLYPGLRDFFHRLYGK